jgi:hypothetical protein
MTDWVQDDGLRVIPALFASFRRRPESPADCATTTVIPAKAGIFNRQCIAKKQKRRTQSGISKKK